MLVVDTNLIAYYYLSEAHAAVLADLLRHDRWWVAPRLWRSELRNVLWTYVRRDMIEVDHALNILVAANALVDPVDHEPSDHAIMQLAFRSNCSAYDCEFVALAIQLNVPLITYDRALIKAFPATAMTPEDYFLSRKGSG